MQLRRSDHGLGAVARVRPTTSMPSAVASTCSSPRRTTVIVDDEHSDHGERHLDVDVRALSRAGVDDEPPARVGDEIGETPQTEVSFRGAATRRFGYEAVAVVHDLEPRRVIAVGHADSDCRRVGVRQHVAQRLLRGAVQQPGDSRGQVVRQVVRVETRRDPLAVRAQVGR